MPEDQAPVDRPEVILPCAAVAAYGEVGSVRPDWWDDEVAKLRVAATDGRWRVREAVALALQRLLAADWDRTVEVLLDWAAADDALVVRAAAAAVAEPPLLRQALGFTVSVIVAAAGDFTLLEHMAASGDPDLRWVARENLKKHRLRRWPARLDHVQALLDA